jgi:PhzF family phenazine biosynthesis protein
MPVPLYTVDAFTDRPFAGNPAAVCLLESGPADDAWMQAVAREMNLSETAFVQARPGGDGFDLRWFTPTVEVDLCGHATLASAHVLWEAGRLPADRPARFHTRSGLLSASRNAGGTIQMDFPSKPSTPVEAPPGLAEALGVQLVSVSSNGMDYLIELTDESAVRGLRPDLRALKAVRARGVIVTARSDDARYDFVSRFFAPAVGVDEDPVTGSAHCCLAPFWAERLGKTKLVGYQASARGGVVGVEVLGDRVLLNGNAVTVLRGMLLPGSES